MDALTLEPDAVETPPAISSAADLPPSIDLPKDTAPKRGRGRPKGSTNKSKPGTPNQTSANRARPSARAKTQVIEAITGLIEAANVAVSLSPFKDDCLSPDESDLLAKAVAMEVQESDRVSAWLTRAGPISAHFQLLQAVIVIAVPRLQRRGILPRRELTPEQMEQLREILQSGTGTPTGESPTAAPLAV